MTGFDGPETGDSEVGVDVGVTVVASFFKLIVLDNDKLGFALRVFGFFATFLVVN